MRGRAWAPFPHPWPQTYSAHHVIEFVKEEELALERAEGSSWTCLRVFSSMSCETCKCHSVRPARDSPGTGLNPVLQDRALRVFQALVSCQKDEHSFRASAASPIPP